MADINLNNIQKHSEVIASCGTHVGTVNHLEGSDKIKLTKQDSGDGMHITFRSLGWKKFVATRLS